MKWTPEQFLHADGKLRSHQSLVAAGLWRALQQYLGGSRHVSWGFPRYFYGFINRDFQKVQQDIGTVDSKYIVNDFITLDNKIRNEKSVLNYIGTIPEQGTNPAPGNCISSLTGPNSGRLVGLSQSAEPLLR